jgi:hypothetical protein
MVLIGAYSSVINLSTVWTAWERRIATSRAAKDADVKLCSNASASVEPKTREREPSRAHGSRLSLCFIKHHSMKTYGGVEATFSFTSALEGGEWSASPPSLETGWTPEPVF